MFFFIKLLLKNADKIPIAIVVLKKIFDWYSNYLNKKAQEKIAEALALEEEAEAIHDEIEKIKLKNITFL